ncbi:YicC family protein [Clostridium niameyense]|uniref:YicC family protein n=1 Tax=Clostridium niameyense TaxID=1622073 RepID=A0A6M0R6Y7_9CLOT|nr:YicC/YloC family endoribonuclease [Clostridium niameyense]NEZ46002.1 YicC family protein [Clostridium niameyense]
MIKSMTGFGRGTIEQQNKVFTVEIRSVNHRYCDINIKMPKSFMPLEEHIRKILRTKVHRGKIDVYITFNTYDKDDVELIFNETLADSYHKCLKNISKRYEVKNDMSVSLIARFPEVISMKPKKEDLDEIWNMLNNPLNEAVNDLVNMREREGSKLYQDINTKCENIKVMVGKIEKRLPLVVKDYNKKVNERVRELLENSEVDENRIAMEVALFVDKSSIDEEIVRLNSHINQLKETLNLQEPIGRKLDFIVQEMNREANTIASKTTDLETVNLILNIKNEIEKIREQVQNIE